MSQLGEHIRGMRQKRELSQLELAAKIGVHQTRISQLETGERGISLPLAIKLAHALGVTVNDLIPQAYALEIESEVELA